MERSRFLWMLFLVLPLQATKPLSPPIPASVTQYSAAILAALSGKSPQNLEPLFTLGLQAAKDLTVPPRGQRMSPLEAFDDQTFDFLVLAMKGFSLNRVETVYADPDARFWSKLAAHTRLADREFFTRLNRTYPQGSWPAYFKQGTDYSGCTDFGTKALTQTYADWTSYRKRFPEAYVNPVAGELNRVSENLVSHCACGDKTSVVDELSYFLSQFPNDTHASAIQDRLNNIAKDEPIKLNGQFLEMRFHCKSG